MENVQVAGTNSFSTVSKYSMICKGYCKDNYLKYFVDNESRLPTRAPIIHRGYYVRFKAVEYGLQNVMDPTKKNVIISLGAGYDTSPFRYPDNFFIEIDYPSVCQAKAEIIKNKNLIENIEESDTEHPNLFILSPRYVLFGGNLQSPEQIIKLFTLERIIGLFEKSLQDSGKHQFNFILYNECSLCYIKQDLADKLIEMLIKVLEEFFPKCSVMYLGYEMLNSYSCRNDFGKFMLSHFQTIQAPILTFLNEDQIQIRFRKMFDQVANINMLWFCRQILNKDKEDYKRIESIEPFDEWESLDNVCASYSLTICGKQVNADPNLRLTVDTKSKDKFPIIDDSFPIHVYGHSTCFRDSLQKSILIFGGFGFETKRTPRRLENISLIKLNDTCDKLEESKLIKPKNSGSVINRIHCRVVSLDGNNYLLSGGRKSPSNPLSNSIVSIDFQNDQFELKKLNHNLEHPDFNFATYRHVCSPFGLDSNKIIQFGGINSSNESIAIFDIPSNQWFIRKISTFSSARHSLAYTPFDSHSILFNGGLSHSNNFSSSTYLELLDHRDPVPKQYSFENFDQKLYSHQMKLVQHGQRVLIIGGIGNKVIANNCYELDMRSMKVLKKYNLMANQSNLMLHSFCSELVSSNNLWLIGGGGHCFSFGTHFNPILCYNLSDYEDDH